MSGLDLPGLGADMPGLGGFDMGLNSPQYDGNAVSSFYVIEPPDDRYIAGYSSTQVDGDTKTVGPRLKDLNIPFSLYGLAIPITFGVRKLYSNIIWAVPLRENIKKNSASGKGGSAVGVNESTTEYEYYGTWAVAFGYAGLPAVGDRQIIRMWADGTLIYDRRGTGQQKIAGLNFRFYPGNETQLPDPIIEEYEGEGVVPAHRGLMYAVIVDLPLKGWGDRPPAISVEIGDETESSFSITNVPSTVFPPITPEAPSGTANMDALLYDKSLNYVVAATTEEVNGWPLRLFDMSTATLLSSVKSSQAGVGWASNTAVAGSQIRVYNTGLRVSTVQSWTFVPWLRLVAGQSDYGAAGSSPFILVDPMTGICANWVGCIDEGPNPEYALMSFEQFNGKDLIDRHWNCVIPHMLQVVPQIVYGLTASDTYFMGRTAYGDMVLIKLNGLTNVLDLVYWENSTNYDLVIPGGVYQGYSDFFAAEGDVIWRIRVSTGADNPSHIIGLEYGVTKTLLYTADDNINNLYYYTNEDALIILRVDGVAMKYDLATNTIVWQVIDVNLPTASLDNFWLNNSDGGFLSWRTSTSDIRELDLTFGTFTNYEVGGADFFVQNNSLVDSATKSIIGIGTAGGGSAGEDQTESMDNAICRYFFDRLEDTRITLASFILGMCVLAGYDEADVDIAADIDDLIDGAIIASGTTFRKVMDIVCLLYRIDMIESEGIIKFKRKGVGFEDVDFDVPQGETLLLDAGNPTEPTFQFRREDELVMPRRINVQYIDKSMNYQWSMMTATRANETHNSSNDITYQIPIVMTASEAKALANRVVFYSWNSRMSFQFRLPPSYFYLEPGDVGTITSKGIKYTMKALEVTYNNDFSIGVRGTSFLADSAIEIVGDGGSGYDQSIQPPSGAQAFIIDTPLIRPDDDLNYASAFPLYVQISPLTLTTSWPGATVVFSPGGVEYTNLASNIQEGLVLSVVSDPVVPDSILSPDTVNSLDVILRAGDASLLVTVTDSGISAGANLAAYGVDGRWELIQFRDVTDNGDGTFSLSHIYRGRRGTDYAVDFHAAGDYLVLLSTVYTTATSFIHDNMNMSFSYKAVGFGQNQSQVYAARTTLAGNAALPWVPTIPKIERSIAAGTGDLTITWNRRDRVTGVMVDGGETVQLRNTEALIFKVTIRRHTHSQYFWDPATVGWLSFQSDNETVEFIVDNSAMEPSLPQWPGTVLEPHVLVLTAAEIEEALLYMSDVPDDIGDEFTTFTPITAQFVGTNNEDHEQIRDLGFGDTVAFKWLDIMIQQKSKIGTDVWGPGREVRVIIEDT